MSCDLCSNIVERTDVPHVIRKCSACGREMHVLERGEHGKGLRVRAGDRFVIPEGWLRLSLNPLDSAARLARPGLDLLARRLFLDDITGKEESFSEAALGLERQTDQIVNTFEPLVGLDVNDPADAERILSIMEGHPRTREFWALWTGHFLAIARVSSGEGNINRAMWAIACAERCRSMMLFKSELEEVVWMGFSVKRTIDILGTWDGNKGEEDEEFWQITFSENSYVLSQVFAVPLVFIQDKAYVGGMKMDRSNARFVDYVLSAESSREAVLIEIKTPTTRLMGSRYRGNVAPSST